MTKPMFITLEGCEGVGKTSNMEFIKSMLQENNINFIETREPGGTPLGESLRAMLLGEDFKGMSDDTELMLMFAARAEHVAQVIKPALEKGQWVLCDRFTDATYAYQGGGRQLDIKRIEGLENWVLGDLRPDLTLLLDAPISVGRERAGKRSTPDRFEQEMDGFFNRVRDTYLNRAKADANRMKVVDASGDLLAVQNQIREIIKGFM
ncbi:MAG: dTMP kinase [endosymbiont of Galathealinum brachiosum]|uniref:Thymidylate kinase n=1 Tax=endosymbiont of Galathealinum brachiosum TaxID=2200906 RepID=A0A370DP82_9GAMM|nr:MAG: dTMP kinase [endosymbiont of Galathealinum brachiosum]